MGLFSSLGKVLPFLPGGAIIGIILDLTIPDTNIFEILDNAGLGGGSGGDGVVIEVPVGVYNPTIWDVFSEYLVEPSVIVMLIVFILGAGLFFRYRRHREG